MIQFSKQQSVDGLVISLDAEKALDRIEWPYLFHTLHKFILGEQFIKWVKLLYNEAFFAVLTKWLSLLYIQSWERDETRLPPFTSFICLDDRTVGRSYKQITNIRFPCICRQYFGFHGESHTSIPALTDTINKFGMHLFRI